MPRTDEWGDDRAERDAEAAIEESLADGREGVGEDARTLWYFIRRSGKRLAVAIGGFGLIFAGILMLVFPGPGWVVIFAGLALLATEFVWAERLLGFARKHVKNVTDAVIGEKGLRSWWAVISVVAGLAAPCLIAASRIVLFGIDLGDLQDALDTAALVSAGVAIVAGHIAIVKIGRSEEQIRGKMLAFLGLLLGYPTFIGALITLFA